MPVKGGYLLAAGGGALLLWSGFKGKNWSEALRAIISGKNPKTVETAYEIQTAPSAYDAASGAVNASPGGSATGDAIAQDALKYQGSNYVWGGAPGNGAGNWDCSSFANAVIGRDLGLAIPLYKPGAYYGQSHGPNTTIWLVWSGCFTIKRADIAAGDIMVWQTHMGIAVSQTHMISAVDQQEGTRVGTIAGGGPVGEILVPRRLKAVTVRG